MMTKARIEDLFLGLMNSPKNSIDLIATYPRPGKLGHSQLDIYYGDSDKRHAVIGKITKYDIGDVFILKNMISDVIMAFENMTDDAKREWVRAHITHDVCAMTQLSFDEIRIELRPEFSWLTTFF